MILCRLVVLLIGIWLVAEGINPPVIAASVEPSRKTMVFPRDHGAHRSEDKEWWYLTSHIFNQKGDKIAGFQLTVFRVKTKKIEENHYLLAHVAFSDLQEKKYYHHTYQIRERDGLTKLSDSDLEIDIPGLRFWRDRKNQIHWRIKTRFEGGLSFDSHAQLIPQKPVIKHGDEGFSKKGPCDLCYSYYSSFSRSIGPAYFKLGEKTFEDVKAQAWFDHEYGPMKISQQQIGWDWFALQLNDGWDIMLARLRKDDGQDGYIFGTAASPNGQLIKLTEKHISFTEREFWRSDKANYPIEWDIVLDHERFKKRMVVKASLANQEIKSEGSQGFASYWEGTCEVLSKDQKIQLGHAYLEMTGYNPSQPLNMN